MTTGYSEIQHGTFIINKIKLWIFTNVLRNIVCFIIDWGLNAAQKYALNLFSLRMREEIYFFEIQINYTDKFALYK